jgi:hypothetical protein
MTTLLEAYRTKILERLNEAKEIWTVLIPYCAVPPDDTLRRWIVRFSSEELLYGFNITASKFASLQGPKLDPERLYRYTTSVLHSEQQRGTR